MPSRIACFRALFRTTSTFLLSLRLRYLRNPTRSTRSKLLGFNQGYQDVDVAFFFLFRPTIGAEDAYGVHLKSGPKNWLEGFQLVFDFFKGLHRQLLLCGDLSKALRTPAFMDALLAGFDMLRWDYKCRYFASSSSR